MKNLKIGAKLVLGFGIVVLLMIEIAAVVMVSNSEISKQLNRIEKISTLQMLSNSMVDAFNGARIEARTIYNMKANSNDQAYFEALAEVEALYRDIFTYIEQDAFLERHRPNLENAHNSYLAWGTAIESIIANNNTLWTQKEQLRENGSLLQKVSLLLMEDQIEHALGSGASTDPVERQKDRMQQANHIKDSIHLFRMEVLALSETYDTANLGVTTAHIDSAIGHAAVYRDDSALQSQRDSAQQVVDIASEYRGLAVAFGAVCEESARSVNEAIPLGEAAISSLLKAMDALDRGTSLQISAAEASINRVRIIVVANALVATAVALFMGLFIMRSITVPVKQIVSAADSIAVGAVDVALPYQSKDELGSLVAAFQNIVDMNKIQTGFAEKLAEGDFSFDVSLRSEKDTMNQAIQDMVEKLNATLEKIHIASADVSIGSRQTANAAQTLAADSVVQAANVEALREATARVRSMATNNAATASDAFANIRESNQLLKECRDSMDEMTQAIQIIDKKSRSITSVIAVIDDIAFQTNILSLNAAVEAARAGTYGRGFAVVANEVRSLASKSARAARETADLIEQSNLSITKGSSIVGTVRDGLLAVVDLADKSLQYISEIHDASLQQSQSITTIAAGIDEVSAVVQANTATAQQTSAASEELSLQAVALDQILKQFRLKSAPERELAAPSCGGTSELPTTGELAAAVKSGESSTAMGLRPSGEELRNIR